MHPALTNPNLQLPSRSPRECQDDNRARPNTTSQEFMNPLDDNMRLAASSASGDDAVPQIGIDDVRLFFG
jgi:hypothetical protein